MKIATTNLLWNKPIGEQFLPWLREVKACGYDGVAGFSEWGWNDYIDHPKDFRRSLNDNGLELASVIHTLGVDFDRTRKACAFAAEAGASDLVCLGGAGRKTSDREALATVLNHIGEIALSFGLRASYHHHTANSAETLPEIQHLLSRTDSRKFFAMCDTGHATKDFASLPVGERAATFIRSCAGRLAMVELKDWSEETDLNTPLGEGACDFQQVAHALRNVDYRGWLVVEQNGHNGLSRSRQPAECARISRQLIRDTFLL